MKCRSCDEFLTDREATRKSSVTGEYLDLCDTCVKYTDISYSEASYGDEIEHHEKEDKE